ncbi:MAG: Ig-like domain-containing protein [Candidatus Dormibacteraeota bacterium]|nr:Ig-like domain-containing protein [Candidatus Dormibacteraeota bacterium]
MPKGVTSVRATLLGAGATGRNGGSTIGTIAVSAGQTLNVTVGGAGAFPSGVGAFGGGGGGGGCRSSGFCGQGGGGMSAIWLGPPNSATAARLIAGGAGGTGANTNAGAAGGGPIGGAAPSGGGGGTQTGGGAGGPGCGPGPGVQFVGGDGAGDISGGGGGGGGWFGGGGGGCSSANRQAPGGGGGSGYIGSAAIGVTNASTTLGTGSAGDGSVLIQWTAPAPLITAPPAGTVTNQNVQTVTGTGTPGTTLTLTEQTSGAILCTTTVAGDGTWSCTTSAIPDGNPTLIATETDPASPQAVYPPSAPLSITIDTVPPPPPVITGPANGTVIPAGQNLPVNGTGIAGDTIAITDGLGGPLICTTTVRPDGAWTCTPPAPLTPGKHTLLVTETDPAGNQSAASTLDLTIATPSLPATGGGGTAAGAGMVAFTATNTPAAGALGAILLVLALATAAKGGASRISSRFRSLGARQGAGALDLPPPVRKPGTVLDGLSWFLARGARLLLSILSLTAVVLLAASPAGAAGIVQKTVTNLDGSQGWTITPDTTAGATGLDPHPDRILDDGSLRLDTAGGNDKATIYHLLPAPVKATTVGAMRYDTFRGLTGLAIQEPSYQLFGFCHTDTGPPSGFITFVYEPFYSIQKGVETQQIATNQWQTWDAYKSGNAIWWATRYISAATGGGISTSPILPGYGGPSDFRAWSDLLPKFENACPTGKLFAVQVNQGSGNAGLHSYVDHVLYNFGGDGEDTNFAMPQQPATSESSTYGTVAPGGTSTIVTYAISSPATYGPRVDNANIAVSFAGLGAGDLSCQVSKDGGAFAPVAAQNQSGDQYVTGLGGQSSLTVSATGFTLNPGDSHTFAVQCTVGPNAPSGAYAVNASGFYQNSLGQNDPIGSILPNSLTVAAPPALPTLPSTGGGGTA